MLFPDDSCLGRWSKRVAWGVLALLCIIIGVGVLALSRVDFDGQWSDSLIRLTQRQDTRDSGSAAAVVRRTLEGSIFAVDEAGGYIRLLVKEDRKVYSIVVTSSTEITAFGQPTAFASLKPMIELSVVAVELSDTASYDFSAEKIDVLTKSDGQKTTEEKLEEFRKFRPVSN